jgi:hypothetical protein
MTKEAYLMQALLIQRKQQSKQLSLSSTNQEDKPIQGKHQFMTTMSGLKIIMEKCFIEEKKLKLDMNFRLIEIKNTTYVGSQQS